MTINNRKLIGWLYGEIKTPPFSSDARIEAGCLLGRLQEGEALSMPHARPMAVIGPRCHEFMNSEKRKKLEAAGWEFWEASDFLNLTEEEKAYVALKLVLARKLAETRKHQGLTQKSLASKLHTSQPRVAMMEKGDTSVTLDLLIRALFALGTRPRQLAALL